MDVFGISYSNDFRLCVLFSIQLYGAAVLMNSRFPIREQYLRVKPVLFIKITSTYNTSRQNIHIIQ